MTTPDLGPLPEPIRRHDGQPLFGAGQLCAERLRAYELGVAEEHERMRDVLVRLHQWADAYPMEVFPEVLRQEWQQANEVLAQAGLSMSRMSASNMRHVINGVRKLVNEGLTPNVPVSGPTGANDL